MDLIYILIIIFVVIIISQIFFGRKTLVEGMDDASTTTSTTTTSSDTSTPTTTTPTTTTPTTTTPTTTTPTTTTPTTTTPTTTDSSYQPYNLNDPNSSLILSQQNAGNINFLKGRIDELSGIKKDVDDLKQNVSSMQTQIDGLVQQQSDFGTQLAGPSPPDITGTEPVTADTAVADEEQ